MSLSSDNPPPGEVFKGRGLRNWLRTAGKGVFDAFPKANDALNFIKANLGSIRRQTFLDIRREVLDIAKGPRELEVYPTDQLIPLDWHKNEHGLLLSSEYQYRIEIVGSDPFVGGLKNQFVTVASDRQLTPGEVQDVARSFIGEGGQSGEIVLAAFGDIIPMRR